MSGAPRWTLVILEVEKPSSSARHRLVGKAPYRRRRMELQRGFPGPARSDRGKYLPKLNYQNLARKLRWRASEFPGTGARGAVTRGFPGDTPVELPRCARRASRHTGIVRDVLARAELPL